MPGDPFTAGRLGFCTAPIMRAALQQAEDVVGPNPNVTGCQGPPLFLCDVS